MDPKQKVLRECPFCGGEVKGRLSNFGVQLMFFDCKKCGAMVSFDSPVCNHAAEVGDFTPSIAAFNKRVSNCQNCPDRNFASKWG